MYYTEDGSNNMNILIHELIKNCDDKCKEF